MDCVTENVELSLQTEKVLNDLDAIVNIDQLNQDNTVYFKANLDRTRTGQDRFF